MTRQLPILFMVALSFGVVQAQGIYRNANSPSDAICPRVDKDKTSLNFGARSPSGSGTGGEMGADSTVKFYYQQGDQYIPVGQRKSVAGFAAYDARGTGTAVASLKGKVVLVGLWSVRCDPSSRMLTELANLYPKREQFGFEILAINFDENQLDGSKIEGGWRAINRFMTKNRQFFEASKMPVYTPGLGREGPSNFMDIVHSLPALFVIDREGNLAQIHIGHKDGFVGKAIQRAILEKAAGTTPAPATVEPAKP